MDADTRHRAAPPAPEVARLFDLMRQSGRPPFEVMGVAASRAAYLAGRFTAQLPAPPVGEVQDMMLAGVRLRLYRPTETDPAVILPATVYFHGGGWVIGDLETHDGICRILTNLTGAAVIAVDYRLAPEHPYPAAIEDAVAAWRAIRDRATNLRIDPGRLALAGDSAGACLATMVGLVPDAGARAQVLFYPVTDIAEEAPSYTRVTEDAPLTAAGMRWFKGLYGAARNDWRASPLRASSHRTAPPAYIVTAGLDPLCDEGFAYVERLTAAGVPVTHRHLPDHPHGVLTSGRFLPMASVILTEAAHHLSRHLGS